MTEQEITYRVALHLVQAIDEHLRKGTRHYYDSRGRLLTDLADVIRAFLDGSLVMPMEVTQ